ncbi:hypothetical protein DACRYDRAFT_106559 [Dacryopinax primogenitus]|uniref:Uncharacterized protein n=1 Tax=Dacryopinax primogenitus (strain DJM 731) TaxID=1858805 RepID=M5GBH0_DACPD|nr:uncharacterized protein DACRYDRAFT_106559 [Dacryopinax primogenitus]EJU03402.1 hypothetical protein DACRYDRAFT_106559 [Dacryopinax primogenitus]
MTNGEFIGQLFGGDTDDVTKIAFSDDNSRIVSGSQEGTIRLWDASIGFIIGDRLTAAGNIRIPVERTVGDLLIGHAKAVYFLPLAFGIGILLIDECRKYGVRKWPKGILTWVA